MFNPPEEPTYGQIPPEIQAYLKIPGVNQEKALAWFNLGLSEPQTFNQAVLLAQAVGYTPEQSKVVAAQWQKESGGGAHVGAAYNYFGIKAHNQAVRDALQARGINVGAGEATSTKEVEGGKTKTQKSSFMQFNNAFEAFAGHKAFLETNQRYQTALAAETAKDFAMGLQKAGYATDPNYGTSLYNDYIAPKERNPMSGDKRPKSLGETASAKTPPATQTMTTENTAPMELPVVLPKDILSRPNFSFDPTTESSQYGATAFEQKVTPTEVIPMSAPAGYFGGEKTGFKMGGNMYSYGGNLPAARLFNTAINNEYGGQLNTNTTDMYKQGGGIHINPAHEGDFTAKANAAGMSVQEYASHVLSAPEGHFDPSTRRQANFAHNAAGWNHAMGGNLYSTGGNFNNAGFNALPTNVQNKIKANSFADGGPLTEFNAGGSHEQNPLGGIPQGMAPDGRPNLVEQGETKLDSANYIFSDNIKVTKETAEEFNLPKSAIGKTFADVSKLSNRPKSRRETDTIENAAKSRELDALMQAQETQKEAELQKDIQMMTEKHPQFMQSLMQQQQSVQPMGMPQAPPAEAAGAIPPEGMPMDPNQIPPEMLAQMEGAQQGMPVMRMGGGMYKCGGKMYNFGGSMYNQFAMGGNLGAHSFAPGGVLTGPITSYRMTPAMFAAAYPTYSYTSDLTGWNSIPKDSRGVPIPGANVPITAAQRAEGIAYYESIPAGRIRPADWMNYQHLTSGTPIYQDPDWHAKYDAATSWPTYGYETVKPIDLTKHFYTAPTPPPTVATTPTSIVPTPIEDKTVDTLPIKPVENIPAGSSTPAEMAWIKDYQQPEKNMFGNPKKGATGQWLEKQVPADSKEAQTYFTQHPNSPESVNFFSNYPHLAPGATMQSDNTMKGVIPVPDQAIQPYRQFKTEGAFPYGTKPAATVPSPSTEPTPLNLPPIEGMKVNPLTGKPLAMGGSLYAMGGHMYDPGGPLLGGATTGSGYTSGYAPAVSNPGLSNPWASDNTNALHNMMNPSGSTNPLYDLSATPNPTPTIGVQGTQESNFAGNMGKGIGVATAIGQGAMQAANIANSDLAKRQKAEQIARTGVDAAMGAVSAFVPIAGVAYGIGKGLGNFADKLGSSGDETITSADGSVSAVRHGKEGAQVVGDVLSGIIDPSKAFAQGVGYLADKNFKQAAITMLPGGTAINNAIDRKKDNRFANQIEQMNKGPQYSTLGIPVNDLPTTEDQMPLEHKYGGPMGVHSFEPGGGMNLKDSYDNKGKAAGNNGDPSNYLDTSLTDTKRDLRSVAPFGSVIADLAPMAYNLYQGLSPYDEVRPEDLYSPMQATRPDYSQAENQARQSYARMVNALGASGASGGQRLAGQLAGSQAMSNDLMNVMSAEENAYRQSLAEANKYNAAAKTQAMMGAMDANWKMKAAKQESLKEAISAPKDKMDQMRRDAVALQYAQLGAPDISRFSQVGEIPYMQFAYDQYIKNQPKRREARVTKALQREEQRNQNNG